MAKCKVKSGNYYDNGNHKNKVSKGENRFQLDGEFSGTLAPTDIALTSSIGTVDNTKTIITDHTTTTIDGKYYWTRTKASGYEGVGEHHKCDENGTMGSSVDGSPVVSTDVVFPAQLAE